jgi:gliding motility-associated-like protein
MIKYFRNTLHVILLLLATKSYAQIASLTPVVIGSAGGFTSSSGMSLSYSVGETVIPTVSTTNLTLTQGFEQPTNSTSIGPQINLAKTDLSCAGANDGTAEVTATNQGVFTYSWSTHPQQNTSVASHLAPGTYFCTVVNAAGLSRTDSVVIKDNNSICGIHAYTGFSPNGDGKNDLWVIDYIDMFFPNTVSIFNRWGDKVWGVDNYDNTSKVFKGFDANGSSLPDGTYFYLIRIGSKEQKGWVEISR